MGCGTLSSPAWPGMLQAGRSGEHSSACPHTALGASAAAPSHHSSSCSGGCVCLLLLIITGMTPQKRAALPQGHFGKLSTFRCSVGAVELLTTPFALGYLLLRFGLCPSAADLAPGSVSLLAHTYHSLQSRHSSRAATALVFPGKGSTDSSNSRCFITPIALGKYSV